MRYVIRQTPCGLVRGSDAGQGYHTFSNISYAKARRWERPERVTHWEGIYDATSPAPHCPQSATFSTKTNPTTRFYAYENVLKQAITYNEDCQRLNIWTPENADKAPVLVFIHGGSYLNGGSTPYAFAGTNYAKRGLVAITINYRLNIFSSAVGGGHTGNYGLWDQITALQWIRENIASFGGDPERITIVGESAGAMSVQNLIYSPLAKGLFHRAIMMSGGGIFPKQFGIRTPETAEKLWEEVRAALDCEWETMQTMPAGDIYRAWERVCAEGKYLTPGTPVVDGITIPADPRTLAETGQVNDVPMVIGVLSEDMWPHMLYKMAVEWGELMEKAGIGPVYGYYFDRQLPGSDDGAYHACDIRYAFGTLDLCWRPFTEIDDRISENMMDYFAAFVETGELAPDGLPRWEPIRKDSPRFLHFGDTPCAMEEVPADRLAATQAKGKPFPTRSE